MTDEMFAELQTTIASLREDVVGLRAELDRLRANESKFVDAYIHKSIRPECQPGFRYRANLAIDFNKWTDSLEEARAAVRRAAGIED